VAAAVLLALAASGAQAALYEWTGPYVPGVTSPSPLVAPDVLRTIDPSVVVNATLTNASGTIEVFHSIGFVNANTLFNAGLFDLRGDVGTYDSFFGGTLSSSGTLRKSLGGGASALSGIAVQNTGLVQVLTGTIDFNSGNNFFGGGSSFQGPGEARVSNGATFAGAIATDGSLRLAGGTFTGGGAGTVVSGPLRFSGGVLQGTWTTPAGATLQVVPGSGKSINGTVNIQGTLLATDSLGLQNANTLTNTGRLELQGDVGTYDAFFSGTVVSSGLLVKTAGSGDSTMAGVTVSNSGTVRAETGRIVFNSGANTFSAGSSFQGPGEVLVNSNASFVGAITTDGSLRLAGGTFTGGGAGTVVSGPLRFSGGVLQGIWTTPVGATLQVVPGSGKSINGTVNIQGTLLATDSLGLQNANTLTNTGRLELQGDVGTYDAFFSGTLVNSGLLVKTAGSGTSAINGVTYNGSGTVRAETGRIVFDSGANTFSAGSSFQGPGEVLVNSNASFVGAITTDGSLRLHGAAFTGGAGGTEVSGPLRWTAGVLQGAWTTPAGSTLLAQPGSDKVLNGTLNVQGTLLATDSLGLQNGNMLNNSGRLELQGDVGTYDAFFSGTLANTGLLVKTAGSGTSAINGVNYTGGGTVRAETGTIVFNSGNAQFQDGSRFEGPGKVGIEAAAQFQGGFHSDGSLELRGGTFAGTAAQAGGSVMWRGGTLAGQWGVAPGAALRVDGGAGQILNGALTNAGHMLVVSSLGLLNGNTLTNAPGGVLELRHDGALYDASFGGSVVNQGVLRKTGFSNFSFVGIGLSSPGTIAVDTGGLVLNQNLAVQGLLDFGISGPGVNGLLAVGGFADLAGGGSVAAHFLGGYVPAVGQVFTVMTYSGRNGSFANGDWTFDGVTFAPIYGSNSFALEVTAVVPEPATALLWLAGLGGVALVARRRLRPAAGPGAPQA
jgi:hypothetical protein